MKNKTCSYSGLKFIQSIFTVWELVVTIWNFLITLHVNICGPTLCSVFLDIILITAKVQHKPWTMSKANDLSE